MKVKSILKERKLSIVFSILFAALVFTFPVPTIAADGDAKIDKKFFRNQENDRVPGYVEGEVLVKFKKGMSLSTANSIAGSLSLGVEKHFSAISRIKGYKYLHLKSKTKTTQQMLLELEKNPDVEYVSPNYILHADAKTPDDSKFSKLWGLHNTGQTGGAKGVDIDAPEAWAKNSGSSEVIVAIIDSGINYNHPDLAANIWVNPNEIENGEDTDGNGFIDDIHGIDAITGSGDPMDEDGHGTHCAGTIGAVGNNGKGVAGVNWNIKMIGVKFLDAMGSGNTADSITCIDYIVDLKTTYGQNIVAINASYGGGAFNRNTKDAIDAAGDVGIIFCAAAGNDDTDNDSLPHYPSSYDCSNIIAVTAVDDEGNQAYNYGATSVDLGAPGVGILSTICVYTPQPGDIFFDDMESGAGNWITGGTKNTWAIATHQEGFKNSNFPVPSPPHFWSDSPGANYAANTDSWLMNANDIDLSGYIGQTVFIGFGSAMETEYRYDHAYVEVSGDGGSNWTTLMDFSGYALYWDTGYSFLIPDAVKTANFRFRFHLDTNYALNYMGWLLDDIGIGTPTCGYVSWNGTSMATPHAAGAAALIAAHYPSDTAAERIARILDNTTPLASLSGKCVTGGMLNLNSAMRQAVITVTSPNGGESWISGYSHNITWTSTGGPVKIQYSANNGGSWSTITSSTANDGKYSWTVPDVSSSQCLVRISEAAAGTPSDNSDAVFTITSDESTASIALNRSALYFTAIASGIYSREQTFRISNSGGGTLYWSISDDASWLNCTPISGSGDAIITASVNPAGLAVGSYSETILIFANTYNSPKTVTVNLTVKNAAQDQSPFGEFSTPVSGSTVYSSIPVTGWVLDDVGVEEVMIFNGSDYFGKAVFVEGARPDVELAFPDYPNNYRAGWGFMLLTNFLPNQGNGTYTISAIAVDVNGNWISIGSKTIIADNDNAVKPFGAIDTPTQGGTASGSSFINWGWALTPQPKMIPIDGSTINVYVDGVYLGHPTYNKYRSDIAALLPGYANSNGAVGYFYLDTTAYENGVHTIQWTATDNEGVTDGIGSRYFSIQNTGNNTAQRSSAAVLSGELTQTPVDYFESIKVKKGYRGDSTPLEIYPDHEGITTVKIKELERIEVHLPGAHANEGSYSGYIKGGGCLRALPVGSTLDAKKGIFYWQPGTGFLGRYHLVFVQTAANGEMTKKSITVEIVPQTAAADAR